MDLVAQQEMLRHVAAEMAASRMETQIVSGQEKVLALKDLLLDLSHRYGQAGAMDHLEYFLSFKDSRWKTPYVVLIGEHLRQSDMSPRAVLGALLIYEHRMFGYGTRIFATDDVGGRRTLLAPEHARVMFAKVAAKALMAPGARAVVQAFAEGEAVIPVEEPNTPRPAKIRCAYTSQRRLTRSYLPLLSTLNTTFANIGQKTRFNMRYYRRRAEAQLGCQFVERVEIGRAEFQALNRVCSFPVTDEVAGWRYDSVHRFPGMFLCGIRDRDGRWLSLVGGRRYDDAAEIDWQMNRHDLPAYSLSVVMRGYLIEHEIGRGSRRLFIEGGTPQAMQLSFLTHRVHDLVVVRDSLLLKMLRRSATVYAEGGESLHSQVEPGIASADGQEDPLASMELLRDAGRRMLPLAGLLVLGLAGLCDEADRDGDRRASTGSVHGGVIALRGEDCGGAADYGGQALYHLQPEPHPGCAARPALLWAAAACERGLRGDQSNCLGTRLVGTDVP